MKTRVTKISNLIFSLSILFVLASCNKDSEFFEKELPGEESGRCVGSASFNAQAGVNGNAQGGTASACADGNAQGGQSNGSTNGGATAGTDGSVNGGTAGGATGSTTGGTTGSNTTGGTNGTVNGGTNGGVDGSTASGTNGGATGSTTGGSTTGSTTGGTTGSSTGGTTGSTTGGSTGGTTPVTVEENFHQAESETKKLDIIWVIDDSGSMADEQAALGTNFSAFIDDFITKDVDFKMAITTTDCSNSTKCGHLVTGSDTKLTSAKAKANEAQFKSDFRNLVKVGTSGSGYEMGLKASEGFMQKFGNSFLRPDAYLAVVYISDEEDQSSKTVDEYVNYLKSFKAEAGLVKAYSIVDVGLSNAAYGSGYTVGYQRYKEASDKTAGTVADIRDDFYRSLADMGSTIINLLDSFALANAADPASIKVFVNGVQTNGFTYDAVSHSIKFDSNNLPPVGASIKVQYVKQ